MKETEYYQQKTAIQIKVGIITILALIILFFGYGWLRDWFTRGKYTALPVKFVNAGNIDQGDPVTLFGVKRGRVESITMTESGVILNLLLDIDFSLPRDTKFYISDSDLMGNRQIDIIPGTSEEKIQSGVIPEGENLAGLSSLIPRIDNIIGNLDQMISKFAAQDELFDNLQKTATETRILITSLNTFFSENYDELESIVVSLQQTTKEINSLFSEEPNNLRAYLGKITQSMNEFDTLLSKLNHLLDEVDPLLTKLNEGEGTLHHLLTEKELYERLLNTTGQIDSLLYDIRDNPKRYFQFRLF